MTGLLHRLFRGACCVSFATLLLGACQGPRDPSSPERPATPIVSALVGDGLLDEGELCDDGNAVSGDGCSASGTIEAGYLCHVPGRPCSLVSLCGNGTVNPGEACDDGNTTQDNNGCTGACDLSLCGDGTVQSRQWPSFAQETCDDGNRLEGDGCSRLCNVEPGFGCTGAPSRCVALGVALFNTGVDAQGRRLEAGSDPHWRVLGAGTSAAFDTRPEGDVIDWPQELPTSRFMAPMGGETCVYQDFFVPSTIDPASLHVDVATFNDNQFTGAQVNGTPFTPTTLSEPPGQPWQKNVVRRFASPTLFRAGLNRITLCNDDADQPPNAFRYLIVDAYDDRCGDGILSVRERCDDGNTSNGDGCSNRCDNEPGYACAGEPSVCAAVCGNGVVNAGEECDDGDTDVGDGCDGRCRVEPGYACPATLPCAASCGDGLLNPGEACDDGDALGGDGCSASCQVERGFDCVGTPSVCLARCGDGTLDPGELCDDLNRRSGDGCSNACTLELGYACPAIGAPCAATCGNGNVDAGEPCDDGNLVGADGCSTECRPEPGYACSSPTSGPSVCVQTCGNGALEANESCDDANTAQGDGCSPGCRVESGFACSGAPSTCNTLCGDGIRAGSERCDDGGTTPGDGCSAGCQIETGYTCPGAGNACFATCGNGVRDYASEACDDADTTNGDGCSGTCTIEPGFTCTGAPSVCVGACGDGAVQGQEGCDDGNLTAGDGCSARCLREAGEACTHSAQCEVACSPATLTCSDDDVAPPAPVIDTPTHESTFVNTTLTVSGTAEPNASVEIFVDGASVVTVTANAAGQFVATLATALALGDHALYAVAIDVVGNVGPASATVTFTIVACVTNGDCAQTERCDENALMCVPIVSMPDGGLDDAGVDAGEDAGSDADVADAGPDGGAAGGGGGCDCGVAEAGRGGDASPFALGIALVLGARLRRRVRR